MISSPLRESTQGYHGTYRYRVDCCSAILEFHIVNCKFHPFKTNPPKTAQYGLGCETLEEGSGVAPVMAEVGVSLTTMG